MTDAEQLIKLLYPYLGVWGVILVLALLAFRAVWPWIRDQYLAERLRLLAEQTAAWKEIAKTNLLMHQRLGVIEQQFSELRREVNENNVEVREDIAAIYEAVKLERPKRPARPGKVGA